MTLRVERYAASKMWGMLIACPAGCEEPAKLRLVDDSTGVCTQCEAEMEFDYHNQYTPVFSFRFKIDGGRFDD